MNFSDEQSSIIDTIIDSKSVFVDSIAGSGKTSTVLGIAQKGHQKSILQLTYNAYLKFEVRNKCKIFDLKNIVIHTYHSLCVNFYNSEAYTDEKLISTLKNFPSPKSSLPKADILIIDEAQDMTIHYYNFINKFILDHKKEHNIIPVMLILGDEWQSIYGFKGSDKRFLVLSNEIWSSRIDNPFTKMKLTESFRLTTQICQFINDSILGTERLSSSKNGTKVDYIVASNYKVHSRLAEILDKMVKDKLLKYEDIFILAPSVRQGKFSVLKKLENHLVKKGFHCHFPSSDDEELSDEIIAKKTVFTTFHQSKGRERQMVIIFNFDSSYFKYYDKDNKTVSTCPSTLYVALTRSLKYLLLIADNKHPPIPFLKHNIEQLKNKPYVQVLEWEEMKIKECDKVLDTKKVSVTQLIRHMKVDTVMEISDRVKQLYVVENPKTSNIVFPKSVKGIKDLKEDVVILNAFALMSMWEVINSQQSTLLNRLRKEEKKKSNKYYLQYIKKIPKEISEYKHYLYIANLYYSMREGIHSKLAQIEKYNWLTDDIVNSCIENIERHVSKKLDYEVELKHKEVFDTGKFKVNIVGIIDGVDSDTVWEFKCVKELVLDHMLQLMMYCWIWNTAFKMEHGKREFRLLNIRTSEVLKLDSDRIEEINEIISIIIDRKYSSIESCSDKDFVDECFKL